MRLANQPHAKVLMASTSESGPGGAGMLTVLVDVTATVGSPAATRPGDGAAEMNSSPATRWPVGWGSVCDTLTEDGEPAEALVLMPEPALPGRSVRARPVALLHLKDRVPADEVVCVAEDHLLDDVVDMPDLLRWHADPQVLAAALERISSVPVQGRPEYGPRAEAEFLFDEAHHRFFRLTGSFEEAE